MRRGCNCWNPWKATASRSRATSPASQGDLVALDDKKSGRVEFSLANIQSAKLVLTDRLIAATRPLDPSGADEILAEQD